MISCFKGKFKVTSPRGYRKDPITGKPSTYHGGLDLVGIDDTTVYAVAEGIVNATPYESGGFGYYVRQLLPDGRRLYYAHLKSGSFAVKAGQTVKVGDKLGEMGSTGSSTGPHTHIELRTPGTTKSDLDITEFTGIPNAIGTYNSYDGMSDVAVLHAEGVINSPEYWETHALDVEYLPELLHNMAERLKNGG